MRKIKIYYFVLTIVLLFTSLLLANAQTKHPAPKYTVTFNNFGAVKVGMTVSQASKALGVRLNTTEQGACRYFKVNGRFKDVGFMVNDGTIARFDLSESGIATDRGAQVGDTEARIKRLYKGQYKVTKHKYTDGNYIEVEMKGGKFSIIFETDGKRVTSIRAGRSPEVGYVEGCS
jgi:hypothetical protein